MIACWNSIGSRQGKMKGGSGILQAFTPDGSTILLHEFTAEDQAKSSAGFPGRSCGFVLYIDSE
jgi:hypothetical protein